MDIPFYFSCQRIKLSGYKLEIFRYGKQIMIGNKRFKAKSEKVKNETISEEEIRKKNMRRAKGKIIDLIHANAWQWKKRDGSPYMPVFITFTFSENVTDLDLANQKFKNFIKRLSYENWGAKVNSLKYLAVVEFQERGAIHYHVVFFNLPFMKMIYDKMRLIWGHGYTWIEAVKTERGIARYLCKYLTKSIEAGKLQARKSYFVSKGLKTPIVINIEEAVNLIRRIIPSDIKSRFYTYESEYLKHTEVDEYNLKPYPKILENIHKEIIDKFL